MTVCGTWINVERFNTVRTEYLDVSQNSQYKQLYCSCSAAICRVVERSEKNMTTQSLRYVCISRLVERFSDVQASRKVMAHEQKPDFSSFGETDESI